MFDILAWWTKTLTRGRALVVNRFFFLTFSLHGGTFQFPVMKRLNEKYLFAPLIAVIDWCRWCCRSFFSSDQIWRGSRFCFFYEKILWYQKKVKGASVPMYTQRTAILSGFFPLYSNFKNKKRTKLINYALAARNLQSFQIRSIWLAIFSFPSQCKFLIRFIGIRWGQN